MTDRKVRANLALTIDGRYNGPGGDFGAFIPYVTTDVARDHMTNSWEGATTAVLGRLNAEGFLGFWPTVADNPDADPRDRGYAKWLVNADKVVLSTMLTDAPWERTRLVNAPAADVITELKATGTGDILVNSSSSIIKPLLAADLIDQLHLLICPEIAGDGQRLFDDGLPSAKWNLTRQQTGDLGEIALIYTRLR
ncbi:dihydrofolate reductase family protein [Dactylosporangium sp. CA-139066]|uniref:dihydrofolate reductase family protein n=1 Tax=Dactylosporangium sp. CA-139066 TaxID=3239930 RepID=UPI003D9500BF